MGDGDDGEGELEIKNNTKNVFYEVHSHQSSRSSLKFVIYFPVVKLEDQYERKPSRIKIAVILNIIQKAVDPPPPGFEHYGAIFLMDFLKSA